VEEHRDRFGVEPVCRVLQVPVSTYYARRGREPSRRELRDRELIAEIHAARAGYRRVYGVRKTWKELRRRGVEVGRDRVARLMHQEGLEGVRRGKRKRTTIPDEAAAERARDLIQRDFAATRPNEKWVADVTYVRTWQGFCYLAFILDCYSRAIVGWQLATHLRTELVLDALEMANGLRRPGEGLIAHSDRGSQYTSLAYTGRLDELGIAPSVGSRGDALDNAMAEAWVATYKSELVDGRRFPGFEHAEHETLHWIGFYNDERLHEELGDVPPAEYERNFSDQYRPFGPVEAGQPALTGGALAGLESKVPCR
jgi:Transposase and inactivated derivatives